MKIALISSMPIFPAESGNNVRILQLCKAIKELGHELTFIHLTSNKKQQSAAAHVAFFGKDHYVQLDKGGRFTRNSFRLRRELHRQASRILRLLGLERGYYSDLDQRWRNAWTGQLEKLNRQFDAVVVEYVFNSRALDAFGPGTRKLLDTHDSFANRHRQFVARGFSDGYWLSLTPQDENRGFRRADAILAIQQQEAENFHRQLIRYDEGQRDPEVAVVSHFIDLKPPLVDYRVDHVALYVGANAPTNRISLQDFLDHVLPLVVRAIPGFKLKIAGSICHWVPDLPNVEKLGFVDDLNQAFAQAPLSINPTIVGTGINIKLLDALSAGVPTVTTTTGARGLPEEFSRGVVVVPDHDHQACAEAIIGLSSDAAMRERLGQAAFADAQRWNAEQSAALQRCLLGRDQGTRED